MKRQVCIGLIVLLALMGAAYAAKPNPVTAKVGPSKGRATVTIPAHAVQVAPGVFSLGSAVDVDGRVVEGYAIVHYKNGRVKVCGNGVCEQGENERKCPEDCGGVTTTTLYSPTTTTLPAASSCYEFLAKSARWKSVEPYMVDPANTRGLDAAYVAGNIAADIAKWEAAASANILGDEVAGAVDGADETSPDNKNEVMFGEIDSPGAIAITIVWGVFGGPPARRELVEWDQVYDDADYDWSATGEAGKMDFESIATHELGHSVGLGDLYNAECSEQTMYGYAGYGETKKRTLENGDITGVSSLY